ncbi:hypothetical protein [Halostella pelagica]|uniref:hypothetical protein n=1 Tax=Halostella pelagica TaxID=2583824 RepID=UPI00107FF8F5|nr:hypothetical protein [Halostella pelagica]
MLGSTLDRGDVVAVAVAVVLLAPTIVVAAHPGLRVGTGDSMDGTMTSPVVAHCTPPDDVQVGDIVSVDVRGKTVMHRVESANGDKLQTKGDGRDSSDAWTSMSDVHCEVRGWWSLNPSAYV